MSNPDNLPFFKKKNSGKLLGKYFPAEKRFIVLNTEFFVWKASGETLRA